MTRPSLRLPAALLLLAGCIDQSEDTGDDDVVDPGPFECAPVSNTSACGDGASVLRGRVTLASGLGAENAGDLLLQLNHQAEGTVVPVDPSKGGYPHTGIVVSSVDLSSGGQEFELDMCASAPMWSETFGEYSLLAVLDQNGNAAPNENWLPDSGEPAAREADLWVEEGGESLCLDIELDCTDGSSCVTW